MEPKTEIKKTFCIFSNMFIISLQNAKFFMHYLNLPKYEFAKILFHYTNRKKKLSFTICPLKCQYLSVPIIPKGNSQTPKVAKLTGKQSPFSIIMVR